MLKLYNGDCLEIMQRIPDNSVDLILCDLPYGTTDCKWDSVIPYDQLWEQYGRVLKEKGRAVLFCAQPFTTTLIHSNLKQFSHVWYWLKNRATGHLIAKKQPMRLVEDIAVFTMGGSGKATYNPQGIRQLDKPRVKEERADNQSAIYQGVKPKVYTQTQTGYPKNVLRYDAKCNNRLHPSEKPVELLEYLIKTYSNCGETVLDNCMGSGSTGIACLNTGRRFIGIEKERQYFDVSCNRFCEWLNMREAA